MRALPVDVREVSAGPGRTPSAAVMDNARRKALAAARKAGKGIIIAADTAVLQGRVMCGKPRSMKDAEAMLTRLSAKPHWVYTGVAVCDAGTRRILVACEKTKVYMDPLTLPQIKAYFAKVSPLDKAGSFDIQGRGAFFIRRIEGCYYTVVGLPLRTLFRLLSKLGVSLLMCAGVLAPALLMSGCSTEYNIVTGQQESYMYSTDREVRMGQAINEQILKEYTLVDDPLVQNRVEEIGRKIAAVCDRRDIEYSFRVLKDDEVNAVSLPGGFVYINSGLLERTKNDDELAGVVAHEVAHIVARHSIKKLQALNSYSLIRLLGVVAPGQSAAAMGTAADAAFVELLMGYSREDELLADQLAARYSRAAGYDPRGILNFLATLQEVNRKQPLRPKSYYKTHPYVPDRIRVVKQELGERIGFTDYINVEQTPHQ